MTRYMLDTNMVGHLLKEHPVIIAHVLAIPMASLCVSVITEAALLFGLAKRPGATRLHSAVGEFLKRVDVVPWDSLTAARYGTLRAAMEREGKTLGSLDLPIAAHALRVDAVLVTNDRTFGMVPGLKVEDWT